MSFGEHLRADQYVDSACADGGVEFAPIALAGGAVSVHAGDLGLGQGGAQGVFDALRALPDGG